MYNNNQNQSFRSNNQNYSNHQVDGRNNYSQNDINEGYVMTSGIYDNHPQELEFSTSSGIYDYSYVNNNKNISYNNNYNINNNNNSFNYMNNVNQNYYQNNMTSNNQNISQNNNINSRQIINRNQQEMINRHQNNFIPNTQRNYNQNNIPNNQRSYFNNNNQNLENSRPPMHRRFTQNAPKLKEHFNNNYYPNTQRNYNQQYNNNYENNQESHNRRNSLNCPQNVNNYNSNNRQQCYNNNINNNNYQRNYNTSQQFNNSKNMNNMNSNMNNNQNNYNNNFNNNIDNLSRDLKNNLNLRENNNINQNATNNNYNRNDNSNNFSNKQPINNYNQNRLSYKKLEEKKIESPKNNIIEEEDQDKLFDMNAKIDGLDNDINITETIIIPRNKDNNNKIVIINKDDNKKEEKKEENKNNSPNKNKPNDNNNQKPDFLKKINDFIKNEENLEKKTIKIIEEEKKKNKNNENKEEIKFRDDDPFNPEKVEMVESLFKGESIFESVHISEDLPKDIHIHALSDEPLSNDKCTICLNDKSCEKGYKCSLCPLIICDQCASMIRTNHFSNDKHKHPMCLLNEDNCKCNVCKKNLISEKNFYFNCKKCNYNICLKCYYPQRNEEKEEEEESLHEHPLEYVSNLKISNCKSCKKELSPGYKCCSCDFGLCKKCYNNFNFYKKRKGLHEHPLFLTDRKNWKCKICESKFKEKLSFYCKKCSFDICIECFLE